MVTNRKDFELLDNGFEELIRSEPKVSLVFFR